MGVGITPPYPIIVRREYIFGRGLESGFLTSGSSTNPSPSPFRPVIPPRPNPMNSHEWRYIYENVDRGSGAAPQTPGGGGGANWRFDEPLSPEINYDQVPLPSNKYPTHQSQQLQQQQQHFAHARPADNPAVPPRPPMTPKNLSGVTVTLPRLMMYGRV